jgi:hypothetical protein
VSQIIDQLENGMHERTLAQYLVKTILALKFRPQRGQFFRRGRRQGRTFILFRKITGCQQRQ